MTNIILDVCYQSQLPMRQLARKGGLLKGEVASASKTVLSVADAVKEGSFAYEHCLLKAMSFISRLLDCLRCFSVQPICSGPYLQERL